MTRSATPRRRSGGSLSPAQHKALAALLGGSSITRSAEAAGIDRSTLHRWLREDWGFQAALNQGRRELHEAVKAQLLHLASQAAETVAQAVQAGDVTAALAILRGLGFLAGSLEKAGPGSAEAVEREAKLRGQEAAADRRLRAMAASM